MSYFCCECGKKSDRGCIQRCRRCSGLDCCRCGAVIGFRGTTLGVCDACRRKEATEKAARAPR